MEARLLKYMAETIEAEIINMIKTEALPVAEQMLRVSDSDESRTFFLKMVGDYKRYLIEVTHGPDRKEMIKEARASYEQASHCSENLFSTHPLRLATALNHSVFLAEIELDVSTASEISKAAFEAALFDIQAIAEDQLKEALRAMQLLKDNHTLWQLDIKQILKRKRAAGHYIEGQENKDGDEDEKDEDLEKMKKGIVQGQGRTLTSKKLTVILAGGGELMPKK